MEVGFSRKTGPAGCAQGERRTGKKFAGSMMTRPPHLGQLKTQETDGEILVQNPADVKPRRSNAWVQSLRSKVGRNRTFFGSDPSADALTPRHLGGPPAPPDLPTETLSLPDTHLQLPPDSYPTLTERLGTHRPAKLTGELNLSLARGVYVS